MTNLDLLAAVSARQIKHFRGVFMKDKLPAKPRIPETGIINLDDHTGPGTHWTCYGITPSSIVYFYSYGLSPPREFKLYISSSRALKNVPIWYSTLPTQTLTDPPICGREVLNVLTVISNSSLPIHKAVHEYTIQNVAF